MSFSANFEFGLLAAIVLSIPSPAVAEEPTVGLEVGGTPLIKAERLAERLGIRELWIKNDTVNYPTLSFKARGMAAAMARAKVVARFTWPIPNRC